MQEIHNSSVLATELCLSCINPNEISTGIHKNLSQNFNQNINLFMANTTLPPIRTDISAAIVVPQATSIFVMAISGLQVETEHLSLDWSQQH